MSDFEPIFTQEELDRIISDRLKRERGKVINRVTQDLVNIFLELKDLVVEIDKMR